MKNKKQKNSIIKRYWNGDESLVFSFWGVSVVGLTILSVPNIVIMSKGDSIFDAMTGGTALIYLIYILGVFTATIFAYIGLWRCAGKYISKKEKSKKSAVWGYLTYVYIFLSVLQTASRMILG